MSQKSRNILFVAFHFPPSTVAGMHRSLNFVRQLVKRGHRVGVLTGTPASKAIGQTYDVDLSLNDKIPGSVKVVRCHAPSLFDVVTRLKGSVNNSGRGGPVAVPQAGIAGSVPSIPAGVVSRLFDYSSRLLLVPDRYLLWTSTALRKGVMLGRALEADVIFSTAPPFSSHLLSTALSSVLDVPLVVDYRDPWTRNPFGNQPYRSLVAINQMMERKVIENAKRVILNTREAALLYREHFPDTDKFSSITNGIRLGAVELPASEPVSGGLVSLLHLGEIYGGRFPVGLLEALQIIQKDDPQFYSRLKIRQVGPSRGGERLKEEAIRRGIGECIDVSGPVPYSETRALYESSQGLLLLGLGGKGPHIQVPSKVYEYLVANRPLFVLTGEEGAIATILKESNVRCVRADPMKSDEIVHGLRRFSMGEYESEGPVHLESFRYENLTVKLEQEFERAIESS